MSSNGNGARLNSELRAAGWRFVRLTGGNHALYQCPCGKHFATVTNSRTSDVSRSGPIQARIRRCRAALAGA